MLQKSMFVVLITMISFASYSQVQVVKETPAGISARLQYEIETTQDPQLGYIPKARLIDAYKEKKVRTDKKRNQSNSSRSANTEAAAAVAGVAEASAASTALLWTERGPYKDVVGPSNGNTRAGNGVTAGRVRAILEDLDGQTIWVGGIDGGLWKTSTIATNPAGWVPVNDFFSNMAIASICQDPTDSNILYFGTGEKAINADAVRGAGIWMSTDHGITWSIMAGTSNFWNVSKVVCDAQGNLYVGCNSTSNTSGLQRFTKSSSTWTNITPTGLDARIADLELSSKGRLHIVCGYFSSTAAASGYRYTDAPATVTSSGWTSATTSFTPVNINVDLASKGDTLYALPSDATYNVPKIYKSTNGGVTWAATGTTPSFQSGQAWYNMAVAIDPTNANNVIVGGLDTYKTTNGGTTWTQKSYWVGTTGQYVHADQQIIVWNSNNRVLVGSDGGVFLSNDGGESYADRNVGLRIKQFYSVAVHPTTTDYFLAGAQDNGVHQLKEAGLSSSVEVTGGDGAFVHIDQNQPQYQWGSYVYSNYRRSIDGGATWSAVTSNNTGRFINPTDYDDVNNIMYGSYSAGTYARWANAQTGGTLTSVTFSGLGTGTVSAIKVSPYNSKTVYFAGGSSPVSLYRVANANTTSPVFTSIKGTMSLTSGNISSIELGSDSNNIILSVSNYGVSNVWVTNNGGTTWTAIDGNLPDMPVRWAMFYPGDNTRAIIATETGVWQTAIINGSSTVWDPETSFPNVRVDMLQYRSSDGLLAASTHGRGVFTTNLPIVVVPCGTVSGLASASITASTATLSWSALSGANSYDVEYKTNASATWTVAVAGTTALSYNLSGLTASTLYDYRVRANCASGAGSYATAQFTTTAQASCGNVTGLSAGTITASGATITWTALTGALNYDVEYKLSTAATWTRVATGNTSRSVALTGLTASTLYDYQIRANCSGATGSFSAAQFTTLTPCYSPYDTASNNTYLTAKLIPANTNVNGRIESSTDVDFYAFKITTAGTATITLTTLPANYSLTLIGTNGSTTLSSSNKSGTNNESITGYNFTTAGTYYIKIAGVNSATNSTSCYTLNVQMVTATGTELELGAAKLATTGTDNQEVLVRVFPNPAKEQISVYLIGQQESRNLKLYNMQGALIHTQKLDQMLTTLQLSQLTKGVYFIRITDKNGKMIFVERIVKD